MNENTDADKVKRKIEILIVNPTVFTDFYLESGQEVIQIYWTPYGFRAGLRNLVVEPNPELVIMYPSDEKAHAQQDGKILRISVPMGTLQKIRSNIVGDIVDTVVCIQGDFPRHDERTSIELLPDEKYEVVGVTTRVSPSPQLRISRDNSGYLKRVVKVPAYVDDRIFDGLPFSLPSNFSWSMATLLLMTFLILLKQW